MQMAPNTLAIREMRTIVNREEKDQNRYHQLRASHIFSTLSLRSPAGVVRGSSVLRPPDGRMTHFATSLRTGRAGALRAADAGSTVTLGGWVHRSRNLGGIVFLDLRDLDQLSAPGAQGRAPEQGEGHDPDQDRREPVGRTGLVVPGDVVVVEEPLGAPVEAYNQQTITSATLAPNVNQVRFTLGNGLALVYDYFMQ